MMLHRTLADAKVGGVCAGLGRHYDWDPTLIRILAIVALICIPKIALVSYAIAWAIMPRDDLY